jgi:hypothetical protein
MSGTTNQPHKISQPEKGMQTQSHWNTQEVLLFTPQRSARFSYISVFN